MRHEVHHEHLVPHEWQRVSSLALDLRFEVLPHGGQGEAGQAPA
jgi:hypothetical protein